MEAVEQLQQLGFSQYEAQAYVTLLRQNPLNGYELAKASGIPRPNIYPVLQKMEEGGMVLRLSSPEGTRYVPVPAGEFLASVKKRHQQSLEAVSGSLQQIETPPTAEAVLNFRGYAQMLDQARTLIERTEEHLLLSIWPEEAAAFAAPVQQALDRGVRITTLCLRGCPQPCPACRGDVFRYAIAPKTNTRWLVLVSDEKELLTGEIGSSSAPQGTANENATAALRTRQPMLVNLSSSYIHNGITLASLITHFGKRLFSELDAPVRNALDNLRPPQSQGPWLEVMQQMLNQGNIDS
jgi:HTH-type transcriptional regulator, sugar sensing transcriptional regulator